MKFINEAYPILEQSEEIFFNRNGERVEKDQKKQKIYAKILVNNNASTYYICTHKNLLYNPSSVIESREKYSETTFKKVSKDIFDFYMIFLTTKKNIYMTKAQRIFLNGN